jgi:hypothetical protein
MIRVPDFDRVNFFKKNSKQLRFSKKNQKLTGCNLVFNQIVRSYQIFSSPVFLQRSLVLILG